MIQEKNQGALAGLKILDFSTLLPGPYASMVLADLGAEVLRVSAPGKKDAVEVYPPQIQGEGVTSSQAWLGRNKKTMELNLKKAASVEIVKRLIMEYDIVLEQFRPGVMKRLGLDYETLKTLNPRLIYCSLTGYGQSGPMRDRAGHDINFLALSGNMGQAGRKNGGPVLTNIQIGDVASGAMNAVTGILAAAYHREKTGEGQYIDIAMLDGLIPFNGMDGSGYLVSQKAPEREGSWLNGGSLYDFYETSDGRYISVGSIEPKFWKGFCEVMGCEDLIQGGIYPEDGEAVKERIKGLFLEKTFDEWCEIFKDQDICVEPVLSMEEAFAENEQIADRQMIVEVPLNHGTTVKQMGNGIKLSETPVQYRHGGYPSGFHTREILENLGIDEETITSVTEV